MLPELPAPARYFPIRFGRYETVPGLMPLGTDYGNGDADSHLFQIDAEFARFRENKRGHMREQRGKCVLYDDFDDATAGAVCRLMVTRLAAEHPALFTASEDSLTSRLTGERLTITPDTNYQNAFDALCGQIQEDIAVVRRTPIRGDWIAALHVCAPSHWSPETKIRQSFAATHVPVPGMEKVNRAAGPLVDAMIAREPKVRFTWGIEFDDRLNHHPDPPPGVEAAAWNRRVFDPDADPPVYFRVERQTLWGLPEVDAALFAIRVHIYDGRVIRADPAQRAALVSALRSMSPESRRYKGLPNELLNDVVRWLEAKP